MFTSLLLALAPLVASASTVYQGFNYGSTFTNGSALLEADFEAQFTTARNLVGISGFTSARLYTMIQGGTTNTSIEAIPAAINTKTTLLLGLWASAGQSDFDNELAALSSAISQYGTNFTSLIAGISVGNEDLYRNSPTGIQNANVSGPGANPADIVSYISQVRSLIANTPASGALIGHVDTWTGWVNGSNAAVISACDFLGMDAYPYFQVTEANSVDTAYDVFFQAYNNTVGVAGGKPVWITETGWPVSGKTENLAVPSIPNAQTYWDQVGCAIFGKINTWWYTLQDSTPTTPNPSFGIVGTQLTTTPLFNLTCPAPEAKTGSTASTSTDTSEASSASHTAVSSAYTGATSNYMIVSGVVVGIIAIAAFSF
jgi:glucan endo-1,3-beta-D-glucosidase